jgi:ankyrin repeat protein
MEDIKKALENNSLLMVKKCINSGIDINQIVENDENENDEFLIYYALHKKCSFDILKYMIESGVDISYVDNEGVGLLDEAIVNGNIEFIKYLLIEKNMDVNSTKRKSGMTPLIQAACYGNIELVKLLLSHGADLNVKDKMNLSAIDYARKLQQKKMQNFLEKELS